MTDLTLWCGMSPQGALDLRTLATQPVHAARALSVGRDAAALARWRVVPVIIRELPTGTAALALDVLAAADRPNE